MVPVMGVGTTQLPKTDRNMSGLLIQLITNVMANSTAKIIETPGNISPSWICWKGGKAINDCSLIDRIMPRNARAAKSEKNYLFTQFMIYAQN